RHARDRKRERFRIALARQPVDRCAAGIAETEQAGALVEGLAGGVVQRRADDPEAAAVPDVEEERVAAGGEQAEKGRLDRLRLEVERGDVAVQMIDRDER